MSSKSETEVSTEDNSKSQSHNFQIRPIHDQK